jgi:CRP/FNR family transcriptional regulator, transcriptional activator FtrB
VRDHERPEIRQLTLFKNMSEESFDTLMRAAYAQNFPPQLELIRQGEPADFLHIVIEGAVELFSEWRGRETTMAVVYPVGTFILAACIKDAPYLMSARTLEKSRLILIPSLQLRRVFRTDPDFATSTIEELAGCYRSMVRHAKNLNLRTSRERLAAYVHRQSSIAGGVPSFVLPVEKRILASYLGMTPENLSRAFKSLQTDGVRVDGQRVIITDHGRLEALAGPDGLIDELDLDDLASNVGLRGGFAKAVGIGNK